MLTWRNGPVTLLEQLHTLMASDTTNILIMQPLVKIALFTVGAKFTAVIAKHFAKRNLSVHAKSVASPNTAINSVAEFRKEYSIQGLEDGDESLQLGPMKLFTKWFDEAVHVNVLEPNAMVVATCSNNIPSARVVLMKGFDERGFVWYTNYNSKKGKDLIANPIAAATFWWGDLERSVRIEGKVEKVSAEESDVYFNSRPRGSQVGAWSSNQSTEISSRAELEEHERIVLARFEDESEPVPRPPHWGGFRLVPSKIEFWKGRKSRMHDRIVFVHSSDGVAWDHVRLQP